MLSIAGQSMTRSVNKTADTAKVYGAPDAPITLTKGNRILGANYTNDGDGTATIVATEGHTLVTGKATLFWAAGIRYNCDITVSGNNVDLSGGSGDAIPATSTECVLTNTQTINVNIDGDAAALIGVKSTQRAHLALHDADSHVIRAVELLADEPDIYDEDQAAANPYTGDVITHCHAANGSYSTDATLQILSLEDATP
jgi:hypothetical protein